MQELDTISGGEVAERFLGELEERAGVAPIEAILFGSRARGDATNESDYDLLLVYDDVTPGTREASRAVAAEYLREYGAVMSLHLISWEEMRVKCHEPFVINARREGAYVGKNQGPRALVPVIMAAARDDLTLAQRLVEDADWDHAVGRAYYAAFHAMTAALASRGLTYSKHSGIVSFYRLHFIKSGLFPDHFSNIIGELHDARETAEYDYTKTVSESQARKGVTGAREVLEAIEEYLLREGFLEA